jgi:hypothetical protein
MRRHSRRRGVNNPRWTQRDNAMTKLVKAVENDDERCTGKTLFGGGR